MSPTPPQEPGEGRFFHVKQRGDMRKLYYSTNQNNTPPMTAGHMIAPGQYGLKTWTPERVSHARKLWSDGFSANQVARSLGGVSRNAVIGKMHREGMPGHTVKVRSAPIKLKRSRPVDTARRAAEYRVRYTPPLIPAEPIKPPQETDIARVAFADLEPHHCRWGDGDPLQPGFGFCGCKSVPGLSYCADHARRAFQPPKVTQRDRANVKPMFTLAKRFGVPQVAKEFDHA